MSPAPSRIALFIDGANLYAAAKTLGFDIDYKRLLKEFQDRGTLLSAFYYTAVIENQEFSSIRPLVDWLDYNGYTVVTKATKEFSDSSGRRKIKANMDIELAVDAMELAGKIDEMILVSGDGDFRSLVEAMQRRGVRVTVVSTIATQPPMIADGCAVRPTCSPIWRSCKARSAVTRQSAKPHVSAAIRVDSTRGAPSRLDHAARPMRSNLEMLALRSFELARAAGSRHQHALSRHSPGEAPVRNDQPFGPFDMRKVILLRAASERTSRRGRPSDPRIRRRSPAKAGYHVIHASTARRP